MAEQVKKAESAAAPGRRSPNQVLQPVREANQRVGSAAEAHRQAVASRATAIAEAERHVAKEFNDVKDATAVVVNEENVLVVKQREIDAQKARVADAKKNLEKERAEWETALRELNQLKGGTATAPVAVPVETAKPIQAPQAPKVAQAPAKPVAKPLTPPKPVSRGWFGARQAA